MNEKRKRNIEELKDRISEIIDIFKKESSGQITQGDLAKMISRKPPTLTRAKEKHTGGTKNLTKLNSILDDLEPLLEEFRNSPENFVAEFQKTNEQIVGHQNREDYKTIFRAKFFLIFVFASIIVSGLLYVTNKTFLIRNTITYRSSSKFNKEAKETQIILQDFDSFDLFPDSAEITHLFDSLVVFPGRPPTIFRSINWNAYGTAGLISGGSLTPEPRKKSNSLKLEFPSGIFGIGAHIFDDVDGTPMVNNISLTITTGKGKTRSISENFDNVGDVGFLGAVSKNRIIKAEFTVDSGSLEVDLLRVIP
ncbi:MAG: hypothetical protein AAFZ15_30495 [Bacteroidota bacterium]